MLATVRRTFTWPLVAALLAAPALAQDEKKEAKAPAKAAAQEKSLDDLKKDILALNNVRSDEAISRKVKELSADKKQAKRLIQAALPLLKDKEESGLNYSAAHILGMLALDVRDYKAGIDFLKVAVEKANKVKSEQKVLRNRLLLIESYLADNRPVDAEKIAEKMTQPPRNVEPDDTEGQNTALNSIFSGRNYLVRASMMQGDFEKAQKHLDFLEKMKENLNAQGKGIILRTKASFFQYKGDNKEAIKVYEELADDADDDEDKNRYREQIGNLLADMGQVDKAYDLMSELLKKDPDNAGLNNDLGYILAVHDRKLDEAEKMVKKAVDKDPDNPSFLDSMAWVYYKQKKYKEAKEWMMKAISHERGRNTELMEHLGDIQRTLGEKDEAKQSYEKALAAVTPSHKDKTRKPEIEKKLKELK